MRWARNDADLDEAQTAALTLLQDIKSWLLALTAVRGVWELTRGERSAQDDWDELKVSRDAELVLIRARRTPGTTLLSSDLVAVAERQTRWHAAFARAWELRYALRDAGGQASQGAGGSYLESLDGSADEVTKRTPEQQDDLDLKLAEYYQKLLTTRTTHAPGVPLPVVYTPRERETAARQAQLEAIRSSPRPEIALANVEAANITVLTPVSGVEARSSPDVATSGAGSATGGQSVAVSSVGGDAGDPSVAASGNGKGVNGVTSGPDPTPDGEQLKFSTRVKRSTPYRKLRLLDLVLSAATLLVTAILYAGTVYNDTWGTAGDFGSAFGAGFLGLVVVKWALLPIYRSVRLRPTTTAS